MLELQHRGAGGAPRMPRKEGVVADGNAPAQDGTAGIREDPVAGIDRSDGSIVVKLAGELDLYNAHAVREALLACCDEAPDRLIVDLSDVKFIDSTALGVLIEARTRMPNRRGFLLAAPGLETRRALEISGLDRHFTVHESLDNARTASV
jgi:anti-sigma B factor antagonist